MQPILSLQDISYAYHNLKGETPALTHINLQISEGEFVAIAGPSGCGNAMVIHRIPDRYAPSPRPTQPGQ